jgi:G2/mitotic-specific cyclin-B, other
MFVQKEVTSETREILVDWLLEVNDRYKLDRETLYLTVNLLDRFLSKENVSYKKIQLVGISAMMIACKYQELQCPRLSAYVRLCGDAYSEDQIKQMEFKILTTVNFNVTITSVNTFCDRFLKVSRSDSLVQMMSCFFMDLCLLHPEAYQFKPSEICASSIYLSQMLLKRKVWSNTCVYYTMYKSDQLEQCKNFLRQAMEKYVQVDCLKNGALKRKYSKKTRLEIFQKIEGFCKD